MPALSLASRARGAASLGFLSLLSAASPAVAQEGPSGEAAPVARPPILPENISTYGGEIDHLFWVIFWITAVTFLLVAVLLLAFIVRYREREGHRAAYSHGNNALEVTWTIATALILIFVAFYQRGTWIRVKQTPPPKSEALLVRVFAEQFAWHFVYAGPDGRFEDVDYKEMYSDNPIGLGDPAADVTKKELIVPLKTPVILELNSLPKYDANVGEASYELPVLHSFFAPNLRLKQDVVPFYPGEVWFEATRTGVYEIACAELCGEGHYLMHAKLRVVAPGEMTGLLGYDWRANPSADFPRREVAALEKKQ